MYRKCASGDHERHRIEFGTGTICRDTESARNDPATVPGRQVAEDQGTAHSMKETGLVGNWVTGLRTLAIADGLCRAGSGRNPSRRCGSQSAWHSEHSL
jgi:hypothetical protein